MQVNKMHNKNKEIDTTNFKNNKLLEKTVAISLKTQTKWISLQNGIKCQIWQRKEIIKYLNIHRSNLSGNQ